MNIYSPPIDEVFESLKTFQVNLLELQKSGNLIDLYIDVPWNKGINGYTRQPHSEESKKKISTAKRGIPSPMKGMPASEESKEKNRQTHLNKTLSDNHRRNIGLAQLGKRHSEYSKKKTSETLKGQVSKLIGTKRPDDVKNKIGESKRGKKRIYREDGSFYIQ